jgi:hypothetical protein
MADNDDVTCQLTRGDCKQLLQYVRWLEGRVGDRGHDVGKEYLKAEKQMEKVIQGIYK